MHLPVLSCWRRYVVYCLCMLPCICHHARKGCDLMNCLWEFHQIYTLGADRDKHKLVRFWGQNIQWDQISTLGAYLTNRCGNFIRFTSLVQFWTEMNILRSKDQRSRSQRVKNQLFKMHRSGKGRLVDGSLSKTLIQFIFTEIVNEM